MKDLGTMRGSEHKGQGLHSRGSPALRTQLERVAGVWVSQAEMASRTQGGSCDQGGVS